MGNRCPRPASLRSGVIAKCFFHDIRIIEFSKSQQEKILAANSTYAAVDLSGGVYRGVDQAVPTIGVWNVMICQGSLDADLVYNLVKALYENIYFGVSYVVTGVGDLHNRPEISPEKAREIMVGPMRMCTWMGLGTHFFCLYIATALGVFYMGAPVIAAAVLIAGLLNIWMLVVAVAWRRGEKKLLEAAGAQS